MDTVGIRELKNRLSHYVREVRTGKSVRVTDRGEVVAELRPPAAADEPLSAYPALVERARRGRLKVGSAARPRDLYRRLAPPARRRPSAAELLDAERGER